MGQDGKGSGDFFNTWMKTATNFWNDMSTAWTSGVKDSKEEPTSEDPKKGRAKASLDSIIRIWQTASSTMNEPETVNSAFKGINTLPDFRVSD